MTYANIIAICSLLTAFAITLFGIPSVIKIAYIKKLYDKPGGRKTHKGYVPNLGGIGIFAAFLIAYIAWIDFSSTSGAQYLLLGLIILHFIGVKDDIVPLIPYKKLIGQLLAASILVILGKFRIGDLQGIFGVHELPLPLSITLSIFLVIVIVNSFNLIDGIDGLAAGISLLISFIFSYTFWRLGQHNMLIASLSLSGALAGFLYFNTEPAKIFMGDAGSMGIGYLMAAFSFHLVSTPQNLGQGIFYHSPSFVLALLIVPLFDTLRVFTLRIIRGKSPFNADCNHIHHKLLELGLSHHKATLILCLVNCLFICIAYLTKDINQNLAVFLIIGLAGSLTAVPLLLLNFRGQKEKTNPPEPAIQVLSVLKSKDSSSPVKSKKPVPTELHLN